MKEESLRESQNKKIFDKVTKEKERKQILRTLIIDQLERRN